MAPRAGTAERLLDEVKAERLRSATDRPTGASDHDLDVVATMLVAAGRAGTPEERGALRGRISHVVVDTWSLDAPLSEGLVSFDDRFLVP